MKARLADQTAPQAARVEFTVRFAPTRPAAPRAPAATPPSESAPPQKTRGRRWGVVPAERPSKIALLLALAYHWERLVREGVVKDYAGIARLTGLTRARVTQIMNLVLLAPNLQEELLLNGGSMQHLSERSLRPIASIPDWKVQERRLT